jgi:4-amino-4-deoxy-L-arabinose transferase-like glycosyltransferase
MQHDADDRHLLPRWVWISKARLYQESEDPLKSQATMVAAFFVVGFTCLAYGLRVGDQPIRGEESRWAQGAFEMLRTGDWIVPRQQGQVFAERPPMNSWLMALASFFTGGLTPWAVRLPSVLAIGCTSLVLLIYSRRWLPPAGACVVALIYCSFGQVLQIGRLGESEAVLAALMTLSLLGWHHFWLQDRPLQAWCLGFCAAGLAALTKGLQGPIYFVAVTSIYLGLHRDFGFFLRRAWWCGFSILVLTVGAWAIPFWLATDWQSVKDIWTGLILDRVTWSGWIAHLAEYPFETLGCLLPWSVFLVQLWNRDFRRSLGPYHAPLKFSIVALCVTFPSVWLVTGARGRYFMPLYGVTALPLGILVWQSLSGQVGSWGARGWWRFARFMALVGVGAVVLGMMSQLEVAGLDVLRQSPFWGSMAIAGTLSLTVVLIRQCWLARTALREAQAGNRVLGHESETLAMRSFVVTVALVAWMIGSLGISLHDRHGNHLFTSVERLRQHLPSETKLISLGPIHHRFEYHWHRSIEQVDWPLEFRQTRPNLDYFCFDYHIRDNAEYRHSGRGRTWTTTPSTLPFAWEEVARIPLEREYTDSSRWVIIGRARRTQLGELTPAQEGTEVLWR